MSARAAAQKAETDFTAQRAQIQARIDQSANEVPASAVEALRKADADIAAQQRATNELIEFRNRIDESLQISARQDAERAALARDRDIKATAQDVIATNSAILADLDEAQDHLRDFIESVVRARKRLPIAQAGANKLGMASSFAVNDFNVRLSQWIAGELCRAWPLGGDRLGSYIDFRPPPNFDPAYNPRWSDREMNAARTADIERLAAMLEERTHIR